MTKEKMFKVMETAKDLMTVDEYSGKKTASVIASLYNLSYHDAKQIVLTTIFVNALRDKLTSVHKASDC